MSVVNEEAGAEVVLTVLPDSAISCVNLAEVASKLADAGMNAREVSALFTSLPVLTCNFGLKDALRTGEMRNATKRKGLSLADRACLAAAEALGAEALTADRAWVEVASDLGVKVRLIR